MLMRIEEADWQLLHVLEHVVAQLFERTLFYAH